MKISDLIRAGGGLDEAAYTLDAELTRFHFENGTARRSDVIPIDLASVSRSDATANLELRPYDTLVIKELPGWASQGTITIAAKSDSPEPIQSPKAKG